MDIPTARHIERLQKAISVLEERLNMLGSIYGAAWDSDGNLVRCLPMALPPYVQVKAGEFAGEPLEVAL